jgi:hypothetical protein
MGQEVYEGIESGGEKIARLAEKIMGNLNKGSELKIKAQVNEHPSYTGTIKRKR